MTHLINRIVELSGINEERKIDTVEVVELDGGNIIVKTKHGVHFELSPRNAGTAKAKKGDKGILYYVGPPDLYRFDNKTNPGRKRRARQSPRWQSPTHVGGEEYIGRKKPPKKKFISDW